PKKYNFNLNNPLTDSLLKERNGVILIELWGSRESVSHHADLLANRKRDTQPLFHDFSRSLLWLGESTMGIWTEEINTVINYFKREYKAHGMEIVADKEYGIASLFASIFNDHIHSLTLIDTPLSYLFDKKGNVDYYN